MARRPVDPSDEAGTPWYAAGLRFRCTACGACCTGVPGYVWIDREDIERMATALGLSVRRFRRLYVRKAKGRLSLTERENGDCVLLRDGKCTVYDAKPTRCSTFPFWSEVLSSREEWEETSRRCEGIDRGDRYVLEEVEALLAGDVRPMLEKQARPAPVPDDRPPDPATWEAALADLECIYTELDRELPRYRFTCAASGRCCDFDGWGHRLYVTTLEAEYFFRHLPERINGDESQCPAWGRDRLCHAREGRMLGCRTYFCGPYPVRSPDEIHERYLGHVKALHDRHGIPFAYRDLIEWTRERMPVRT